MATEKLCETLDDVIQYLQNEAQRHRTFYHYTNLAGLLGILKTGYIHIASIKNMNDKTEVFYGDQLHRDNAFSFSFASGTKENMALWGLYSIPWAEGVRLDFGIASLNKLLEPRMLFRLPDEQHEQYTPIQTLLDPYISLIDVAYCDDDEQSGKIRLRGNIQLSDTLDISNNPQLIGYIKKDAWQYENETRIRVYFDNVEKLSYIAMKIPDEVYRSIRITAAPWFQGNLGDILKEELGRRFSVRHSAYTDLVNYRDHCYYCEKKPFVREQKEPQTNRRETAVIV